MKEYCVERYNSLHVQNVQFRANGTKSILRYKTLIQLFVLNYVFIRCVYSATAMKCKKCACKRDLKH